MNLADMLAKQKAKAQTQETQVAVQSQPVADKNVSESSPVPSAEVPASDASPAVPASVGSTGIKLNLLGGRPSVFSGTPSAGAAENRNLAVHTAQKSDVAPRGVQSRGALTLAGLASASVDGAGGDVTLRDGGVLHPIADSGRTLNQDEIPAQAPHRVLPEDISKDEQNFVDSLDSLYQLTTDMDSFRSTVELIMIELAQNPEYRRQLCDEDIHVMISMMRQGAGLARIEKAEAKAKRAPGGSAGSRAKKSSAAVEAGMELLSDLMGGAPLGD